MNTQGWSVDDWYIFIMMATLFGVIPILLTVTGCIVWILSEV